MTRLEVEETDTLQRLYELVGTAVSEAQHTQFSLSTDPAGSNIVPVDATRTLQQCGMVQGQMIFLMAASPSSRGDANEEQVAVEMDKVDREVEMQDGRIPRKGDRRYCKHGAAGMCSNCQPLEPYDANYAEEHGIKHLSFHAHLRKIGLENPHKGVVFSAPKTLEEPDYRVKRNCGRHAPYPKGICSQCQPSAITLKPQSFRFTDHVEFASATVVEAFLAGWRTTGYQRFGWMLGTYETYDGVPLGIKAVVQTIVCPPQDGSVDGFQLLGGAEEDVAVTRAAQLLGLQCVGMIYTDLRDDGTKTGKVEATRGAHSFFLSSAECLFIADQQRLHPNPCRHSPTGRYGSKFVTVVLTGDEEGSVGVFAYQVSVTAMGMQDAGIVQATTEPALMMTVPATGDLYVPDVLYQVKNEFGAAVQMMARPTFPVDFFVVSVSHGFPRQDNSIFSGKTPFTGAPSLAALARYLLPLPSREDSLLLLLSSFDLFLYLSTLSEVVNEEDLLLLAQLIRQKDSISLDAFLASSSWQKLLSALQSSPRLGTREAPVDLTETPMDITDDQSEDVRAGGWACPHCTFLNPSASSDSCEVCSLPRRWDHH